VSKSKSPRFSTRSCPESGCGIQLLANAGGWQRYFFITLGLAVSAWLGRMLCQQRPRLEAMGYSLILGGALGNVIVCCVDRLLIS
jgi:signal peptidase II